MLAEQGETGAKGDQGEPGASGTNGEGYRATSTSSVTVGTGPKTFTTQTNLAYSAGARARASSGANYLEGVVIAYDGGTGGLTINVDVVIGSGTFAIWNINLAGQPGTPLGAQQHFQFSAAAGQTAFGGMDVNGATLTYTPGQIEVAVNGLWIPPSDYAATDAASVVLSSPSQLGDTVYMFALSAFNPVDTLTKSQNGGDILDKALFSAALNAVRCVAQTLTTAQQLQARTNIGAAQSPTSRTRTVLTSSSGTYVTPPGCKAINVRMVGGGGGGGGGNNGSNGAAGGAGGTTTFGSSLLVANGGGAGGAGGGGIPMVGGTASGGDIILQGGWSTSSAGPGVGNVANPFGGNGGNSVFGGAGAGAFQATGGNPGNPGVANTGGGGGGGAGNAGSGQGGGGGGAGGYCEKLFVNPAASFPYAVGAGGAGGAAGSSGGSGGTGGSGIIIIDEFY